GVALFAIDLASGSVGFMGLDDPRVIAEVMARARRHAIAEQLLVLATLVAACALFGAAGGAVGRAWDLALDRAPRRRWLRGIAGALAGHGWLLARSMSRFPALYSAHFYERGGARRAFMLAVTDHLSTRALDGLALALAIAALAPLIGTRRGRAWTRRRAR